MANPIVHFEIIGRDPAKLRAYYKQLFGWDANTHSVVAPEISQAGQYGFIDAVKGGAAIPGGIGGGESFTPHTVFYVGVPDVGAALDKAVSLGGKRVLGPVSKPDRSLTVAQFADPEGNVIGLAGPR